MNELCVVSFFVKSFSLNVKVHLHVLQNRFSVFPFGKYVTLYVALSTTPLVPELHHCSGDVSIWFVFHPPTVPLLTFSDSNFGMSVCLRASGHAIGVIIAVVSCFGWSNHVSKVNGNYDSSVHFTLLKCNLF